MSPAEVAAILRQFNEWRRDDDYILPQPDPRGRTVYWIGPAGPEQDAGPGTDFHAVRTGHISITPIHVDLTRYQALEKVAGWVGGLSAALATPLGGGPGGGA